jgi:hypothetical protein
MHLAPRIAGHPEPEDLHLAAQARSQLIQLHMRTHEIAEGALMQGLGMRSCPQQPARDRRMPDPKNSLRCRQIQPFRQGTQHQCYPMRRRFQPIQRRVQTCAEGRPTHLRAPPLDPLSLAAHTIANQRVDVRIADPIVLAGLVGTGKPFGLHAFGRSPPAFDLLPRSHRSRNWFPTR